LRWVVFDYGEVISERTAALPDLHATLLGSAVPDTESAAAFERAYWAERDAYDRGMPDLAYWSAVAARLGLPVDAAKAAELTRIDVRGWLRRRPASVALIEELHEAGVPLALLSNAPSAFGREVERQPWSARFRELVFSGDFGMAKPDAEIWKVLLDRLDARPSDCVFLDDRQVNVDGAILAGLDALRWNGADQVRARLADLGLLGSH
jgi:putative hydrolase of the HAD superfamily